MSKSAIICAHCDLATPNELCYVGGWEQCQGDLFENLKITELKAKVDRLEKQVEKWKQVAENAAVATTKTEACEIVESALACGI